MKVQTFTIAGIDVDMMFNKGALAYTFKKGDQTYGISTKLANRKIESVIAGTFLLFTNALETINKLNENNGLSKGA